jgi:chorismate dehydratase
MPRPLRVGLFPYLNVQPLVFGLSGDSDFELVLDLPARIADRFRDGELDLAMVPSLEAATLGAPILDSVCIGSDGGVETVVLLHRVPLARVKSLAVDEASRTSAALAKILIVQASGRMPSCTSFSAATESAPDLDAAVVIGDPAFTFALDGFERLDLGAAWKQTYSLPFVFAVMAAGPRAAGSEVSRRLGQANQRGLEAASTIARSYNSGVDPVRAEHYLRSVIRYDLRPREKEGLALFYRLAQANGLLAEVKELRFHAI